MKGRLISVNSIPHAYSELLHMAFELSIQDRNELNDDWLGSRCLFNTELGYAKIIPNSITPSGQIFNNEIKTKENEQYSRTDN